MENLTLQENLEMSNYRPIYSPRSTMSLYLEQVIQNKTSLIINIDRDILSLFKNQFDQYTNQMNKQQFVYEGFHLLKSWQKDLPGRSSKIIKYLSELFDEACHQQMEQIRKEGQSNIQHKNIEYISWQNFNRLIISKALNLKSLQTNQTEFISLLKPTSWRKQREKLLSPIQKILCLNRQKKIAYMCEQSNKIQFLSLYTNQHTFKPIVLDKQELTVQKSLVRRVKDPNIHSKALPVKQNYKKDVVVSNFRITFLDMIYISNDKYRMLLTSSSDCIVRGWDIHGSVAFLAKQPQSQEQKMIHQFPVEIHCMVWDQINEILYCSGKNSKIYLWMVKTDSERELTDPQGHNTMISSMIMMPKLQFLASGGYDGKLILWDTISLTKKFKYQEHIRSIVSMTFHEGLILLFTAAFDHSICVWNPYIPSLIYKIPCNINVIQISIIPGTHYLAALDSASNLKIREIKKFTLFSTYVVDRPDDIAEEVKGKNFKNSENQEEQKMPNDHFVKIEPSCMAISNNPLRFFFAGNSVKCMQFDENEALMASDYYPNHLKYCETSKKLYVTLKNNLMIWDMLTGRLMDILSLQTENEITAIDFISSSGLYVVGDLNGAIYIRKRENGIKIMKLYQSKTKSQILHLISKQGGIWNQSVVIGCTIDCEIIVFGKDKSNDYIHLRTIHPRKYLTSLNLITSLTYEEKRNILILGCSNGDLLFMDVDKTKVTNHIRQQFLEFYAKTYSENKMMPEVVKLQIIRQIPCVLAINKGNQMFGVYLPPHIKKFKTFYDISFSKNERISSSYICKLSNKIYIGYENGDILKMGLKMEEPMDLTKEDLLVEEWEINLQENIKQLVLIERETIIAAIVYSRNISLLSARTGETLNVLPSHGLVGSSLSNFDANFTPVSYYDQENQCLFDVKTRKSANINNIDKIRIFHDPYYLYQEATRKKESQEKKTMTDNQKSLPIRSNNGWKIQPYIKDIVADNIRNIKEVEQALLKMNTMPKKKRSDAQSLDKVKQMQKKWEKNKQEEEDKKLQNIRLLKMQSFALKTVKISDKQIKFHKKNKDSQKHEKIDLTSSAQQKHLYEVASGIKHSSLHKVESSPMFKLGLALKQIDDKDAKAQKFMELAQKISDPPREKKKSLKFPKIK